MFLDVQRRIDIKQAFYFGSLEHVAKTGNYNLKIKEKLIGDEINVYFYFILTFIYRSFNLILFKLEKSIKSTFRI